MPLFFADQESCVEFCEQRQFKMGPWTLEPILASTDLAWKDTCTHWCIRLMWNDGCGNVEHQGWLPRL